MYYSRAYLLLTGAAGAAEIMRKILSLNPL